MATITYHTLHSTQTVVLPADVTAADGTVYKAGSYQFGRHAQIGELGVGTATAPALQLGLGIAGLFAGIGLFALLSGFGLVWATQTQKEAAPKRALQPAASPA